MMDTIVGICLIIGGFALLWYVAFVNTTRKLLEKRLAWLIREGKRLDRMFVFVKAYQVNQIEMFKALKVSNMERYEFYYEKLLVYTVEMEAGIKKLEEERSEDSLAKN